MEFLSQVIKESKNEFASFVSDGISAGDVESFVDTGSYMFNAIVSGSLYGGIPSNKITALAGESGTGKTFFCLSVVRSFLDTNPEGGVIYFETESAISKKMIESRGIDSKRMIIFPVATIEEFRTQSVRIIDKYMETPKEERKPLMFVLDSLGMLATNKEVEDASNDKNVRDMTKAQLVKSVFRILTLKLGKANIPMIVTNHTYDVVGCALKETKIKTPDGNIDISEIKVGDYVNTMVGSKKVIDTYEYEFDEYYQIELENGSVYNLTGEHKLMTQEGEWKKVSELTEEDVIINIGN